jgi:hypothetical protein
MKNLKCITIHASSLGRYVAKKNKNSWQRIGMNQKPLAMIIFNLMALAIGKKRLSTNTGFGPELFGSNLT